MIDSLVTQGIEVWRDFLVVQELNQPQNNQRQLSTSLANILQSLHTVVVATCSNSSPIDGRCWYRLQVFCYLIKGVGLVVTLTAATVMSPTSHEQMVMLRQACNRDSTDTSSMSSSSLSRSLQDLRTVPLPRSLLTVQRQEDDDEKERPTSAVNDDTVDSRWLAMDILERVQAAVRLRMSDEGDNTDADADSSIASSVICVLCIEMARMWTDLSSSSPSCDEDCLWAHGALSMLHDLLGTTTTTTSIGVDSSVSEAAAASVQQLSMRQRMSLLSSAALVAMLPAALHLVDRPTLPSQALGTLLLWELLAHHSSSRQRPHPMSMSPPFLPLNLLL